MAGTNAKLVDELPVLVRTTSDDLVAFRVKLGIADSQELPSGGTTSPVSEVTFEVASLNTKTCGL